MKRRIVQAAGLGAVTLALTFVPALALQSAQGAPKHNSSTGATLQFNPTTGMVGQQYTVNGSGFGADHWVTVGAHYADATYWASGKTDGQGNLRVTLTATSAGQIYHEAKEQGNSGRLRFKTSATFTVNSG
jgi:hypothetical protein